jgi:DNA-binding NarL/FixJ family response regulator
MSVNKFSMAPLSILIVDDHKFITQALTLYFREHAREYAVTECNDDSQALSLASASKPTVIILDIQMRAFSGLQLIEKLRDVSSNSKIVVFSMHNELEKVKQAYKKGANGYVTKNSEAREIITAIKEVTSGRRFYCSELTESVSEMFFYGNITGEGPSISDLTERERTILKLIKSGLKPSQIAKELEIARSTINVYRFKIMKKLSLRNTAEFYKFVFESAEQDEI